jgi:uncharacterized membrane protein YfcA
VSELLALHLDGKLMAAALLAALVNGAIGYGFSTLLVPIALLFYRSAVLNPGLVLAEVVLNLLSLLINRRALPKVWRGILPMMLASLPGIALGGLILRAGSAEQLRFSTFIVLLPLVLLQAAGVRRPLPPRSRVDLPVGFGIGVLYACTTISGPPLGLLFNNQGLAKDEFRAAMSLFRVTESVATSLVYLYLGVYSHDSVQLSASLLPCIVIGIPLGRLAMTALLPETFRRLCMTFDAWLISFGLSRILGSERGLLARLAYVPMALVVVLDAVILFSYFRTRRTRGGEGG